MKTIILDGATGTEYQKKGMQQGQDSTAFALANPDVVKEVARNYAEAGSEIIYAPTFNLNRQKVEDIGLSLEEITEKLARPVLELREEYAKAGRKIRVAFDIGPQGEMVEPLGKLTFEDAYDFYAQEAKAAQKLGVDVVTIETMTDIYDVKAAVLAVKENTDLPVFATMSFEENGRTFTGTSLETMAIILEGLGVDAMGINCSLGPVQILPLMKKLRALTDLPIIAKPNAGLPDPATGGYDISCDEFVDTMKEYVDAGVDMVGGCCGTDPDYVRGIAEYVKAKDVKAERQDAKTEKALMVCSGSKAVTVDHVTVIGERLNPTGKKKLKTALLEGDYDYVLNQAQKQIEAGAEILDVNVGVPGLDEASAMPAVVKKLQSNFDLPLQIDSSNPDAIEAALRVYNGKAIVNSVNGDPDVMEKILPMVKKYGAAVIGLTLDSEGIPETAEKRFAIAERILAKAMEHGIRKEDVIIDCLTLTASAQQKEVNETLKTVRRVKEELGLKTALGVSNVSFGLPLRPVINRTFLTMALENGLDLPIINPNDEEMMASVFAFNVLKNRDTNAVAYIDRYAEAEVAKKIETKASGTLKKKKAVSAVAHAIDAGLEGETAKAVEELLEKMPAMDIVNNELIPALDAVGRGFEKGEIFLPAMMQSAQAAQAGFDVIKKALDASGEKGKTKGDVVIATVKGDIHDIGKNIVKVIMENYGFNMIDLGRDVPADAVVDAVKKGGIRLVGLSALMTTTLASMEETIKAIKAEAPGCRVMVGGAVLTEEYAAEIGADFYCRDAMKSVEAAQKIFD
ncbi:MAG: homocysteine S-methyltransferase family protein [Clostridia bacterium]|nr:homocysteine S-methyltransferase family protein [Clostridia bacterium]